MKISQIRSQIYHFTVFLSLASVAISLISSEGQRELFYFSIFSSIIGLSIEKYRISFKHFSIAMLVFLIGLSNLIWYFIYEYQYLTFSEYSNYLNSGKKIILSSLLIFYIDTYQSYIKTEEFRKYFLITTAAGFILATGYALWQHIQGIKRIEMAINRATISSYVYSVLSLSFIDSLYRLKHLTFYIISCIVLLLAWYIIIHTDTRAAIGLYLLMAAILLLIHSQNIHKGIIVLFLCFIVGIAISSYKSMLLPKLIQTKTEIRKYKQGIDNTSLGSRFSMWIIGIKNGIAHPLGQSTENRRKWTYQYVQNGHLYLATSLMYINVHLHNEFIERYSLQGIPGILTLFLFFFFMFYEVFRKRNKLLLLILFFLVMYGLTDVILLSSEALLFFMNLFALTPFFHENKYYI